MGYQIRYQPPVFHWPPIQNQEAVLKPCVERSLSWNLVPSLKFMWVVYGPSHVESKHNAVYKIVEAYLNAMGIENDWIYKIIEIKIPIGGLTIPKNAHIWVVIDHGTHLLKPAAGCKHLALPHYSKASFSFIQQFCYGTSPCLTRSHYKWTI